MQLGLASVLVFAPLAKGVVRLWSVTAVELVIFVLLFLWLWRVNNRREIDSVTSLPHNDIKKTELDFPVLIFGVLAVFSCVFSIHKHASVLEAFRMAAFVAVFYLVVNNFSRHTVFRFAALVIVMGTGMSLLGLGQYFFGLEHSWWVPQNFLSSTYVNHNHFAGYLEMAIPLAISMFVGLKRDRLSSDFQLLYYRIGLIAALSIMFTALVFSQSRGAWISLCVSLAVMNIILVKRGIFKKESLAVFFLLVVIAAVYINAGDDSVARRLRTVEQLNEESFIEGRKKIWQGTVDMIKDHPLVGTGVGTFVWGLPAYRPEGLEVRAYYAHNDYLHMMAEMGILALPLMLWVILLVIGKGFKAGMDSRCSSPCTRIQGGDERSRHLLDLHDGIVLGSAVGVLSLALHGLVDFNFHITANMLTCSLLAGFVMRR